MDNFIDIWLFSVLRFAIDNAIITVNNSFDIEIRIPSQIRNLQGDLKRYPISFTENEILKKKYLYDKTWEENGVHDYYYRALSNEVINLLISIECHPLSWECVFENSSPFNIQLKKLYIRMYPFFQFNGRWRCQCRYRIDMII